MSEGKCEREPVLEDVRTKLDTIFNLARRVVIGVSVIDEIIDVDLNAGLNTTIPSEEKSDKQKPPNLRFDMNNMADNVIAELEEALNNIKQVQSKLRINPKK